MKNSNEVDNVLPISVIKIHKPGWLVLFAIFLLLSIFIAAGINSYNQSKELDIVSVGSSIVETETGVVRNHQFTKLVLNHISLDAELQNLWR